MEDVRVSDHGSMVGLEPVTDAARAWIGEHIPDDAPWLGKVLMVEARLAPDVLAGMVEADLIVELPF